MTSLRSHAGDAASAGSLLTGRFSRHPGRYLELLRTFHAYELHHVLAEFGMGHRHAEEQDGLAEADHDDEDDDHPENLASALETLGPCFIKLGQLLSTRPDLLPPPYIRALARLQDTITPVPYESIVQIVEGELGAPLGTLFQAFGREPLATASMAQVHRAVLADGTEVAVKVQRPGVRQQIEVDLEVLHEIARFATRFTPYGARYGLLAMVRELEH